MGGKQRRRHGDSHRSSIRDAGRTADSRGKGARGHHGRRERHLDRELRLGIGDEDQPVVSRSRGDTTPLRIASSARRIRFLFWGRSPTSNRSNRARRFAFTASTERNTSSAISLFEAGLANSLPSRNGRQRATRTRRWVSVTLAASGRSRATVVSPAASWAGERYRARVLPNRRMSPRRRRRLPSTRSPLTNEPFRDRPSSTSTQSPPIRPSPA